MRFRLPRRPVLVVMLVLVAVLPPVSAGELVKPSPEIEATGKATIYHDDVAGARERAVRAGLVRALERYAGLRIEASTLISRGELIGRQVKAHTHGFVRSFEVVDEWRDGPELAVKLRVRVEEAPVEESFGRYIPATTILLVAREANLGEMVNGQIIGAVLSDPFVSASLVVGSDETIAAATKTAPVSFFSRPDSDTTKELGFRYLSGLIVVANAITEELDTSADSTGYAVDSSVLRPVVAASGNVWVLDGQSGETIASQRFDDVRGSDASDAERAGTEALGLLADQMKSFVVDALTRRFAEFGFPLQVIVTGPQAADGAPRVRQILETTRWVESVKLAEEAENRAVLQATCREKPVYVIEELRQAEEVEIVRFSAAAGEVELR